MATRRFKDVQCVAALGFDVDGVTMWGVDNPKFARLPSLMSMGEYGPATAVPRILKLLDDYDIKASFYIPGYVIDTHEDMVKEISSRGHEIGHHGYMHETPAKLDQETELDILERGIACIERVTGRKPLGYRSPEWEVSENTLSLVASHGFTYDSSLMDKDVPYVVETDAGPLMELPVQWLLDDFPYFGYSPPAGVMAPITSPDNVFNVWSSEFEGAYHYTQCFVLTMHPQIIGHPGRLLMLERLIKHIRSFPGTAFMRNIDLVEYWMDK